MPRAMWKGKVIAESDQYQILEGNIYFPFDALNLEHFQPSVTTTVCGWKGTARYFNVVVDGDENCDAAWWKNGDLPVLRHTCPNAPGSVRDPWPKIRRNLKRRHAPSGPDFRREPPWRCKAVGQFPPVCLRPAQ